MSLTRELQELQELNCTSSDQQQDPPAQQKKKGLQLWASFDMTVKNQAATSSSKASDDIRQFFTAPLLPRQRSPLDWWAKEGQRDFPSLYKLAVKYLIIPATSVPAERFFSCAGEVISKRRSRLEEENARILICLHQNLKAV